MGTVPRIGLRRTQAVDDLLNGIWELRPELKRKNTTTILLGLEAFLRECKTHTHMASSHSTIMDFESREVSTVPQPNFVDLTKKDNAVSDDIEW